MPSSHQLEFIRRIVFQLADKQINPKAAMEVIEVYLRDAGQPKFVSKVGRKRKNSRRGKWTLKLDG